MPRSFGIISQVSDQPPNITLLNDPHRNKETSFTQQEREQFGLLGLLPDAVEDIELQAKRVLQHLGYKSSDLERYIYLNSLLERNETLFFHVLMSDPQRFLPIVYTPTVGEACLKFGGIYRRARGMYLSIRYKGRVREVLRNWPVRDVRFICVSTGGRILALGDLGANGMGIVIGKLQLYTICAAIPPHSLMPLLLDIGTTNQELLNDPLYLGLRQKPPLTDELDAFVEEFVQAVQEVFPHCCIHFEDFKGADATRLLNRYIDRVCCYNDDIQGTGAIVVAALHNAMRITGQKLAAQRILFLGAGSSAIGVAEMIGRVMQQEGLRPEQARQRIFLFDSKGLVVTSRDDLTESDKRPYACKYPPCSDLAAAVEILKPTVLIGVSTRAKMFDARVIQAMARVNERPIIFAMSNPTDHAECTAEEAYAWSGGRAIFAAGVQFPPVDLNGRLFLPAQANNYHVFPALSLAVYATRARRITYRMWLEAATAVAQQVSDEQLQRGMLLPAQADMLNAAFQTAQKIAQIIFDDGLAAVPRPPDIAIWLREMLYRPEYAR